ncbi:MAG: DNA recombination/repair protein RecA, partial [Brevibacterium aurantiacum]|nr:DNA recombination/repair protein RecA [Brevibacterium aurantiacum]
FTYDGDQLGQGKENVRNFLRDNPGLAEEVELKIKHKMGLIKVEEPEAEADQTEDTAAETSKSDDVEVS